jgi:hypothetical protein
VYSSALPLADAAAYTTAGLGTKRAGNIRACRIAPLYSEAIT